MRNRMRWIAVLVAVAATLVVAIPVLAAVFPEADAIARYRASYGPGSSTEPRRPVNRAVAGNPNRFVARFFEMVQMDEIATVNKTAVVVEEAYLGKGVTEKVCM
jgi:hypothetical protein